ncbi:YdeI/OmpD-associated family protein [Cellulomonas olei]|uniref:YdeI/OmpD-associated family protein n=1 Tax=Cellulomonas sp. P4 TaxID=3142533 RepID=UPI0031BA2359
MVTLHTTLVATGGTTTGIEVPEDVVLGLGRGKRVPVSVTIGAHTFRGSVAPYSGGYWVGVSAANRAAAGIAAGDDVEVVLEVDDAPRTVEVPPDLAEALAAAGPAAGEAWAALSYSKQRAHVLAVEGAKTDATRRRRVAAVVDSLG